MSEIRKKCSNCKHIHMPRAGFNSSPYCDCGRQTAYKSKHNGTMYVKGEMSGCLKWEEKTDE